MVLVPASVREERREGIDDLAPGSLGVLTVLFSV